MPILNFFKNEPRRKASRPPSPASSRRQAVRRKLRFVEGRISWPTMLFARRCAIKDLSPGGACLELTEPDKPNSKVPATFTLTNLSDSTEVACSVVWRDKLLMGVRFLGELKPVEKPRS